MKSRSVLQNAQIKSHIQTNWTDFHLNAYWIIKWHVSHTKFFVHAHLPTFPLHSGKEELPHAPNIILYARIKSAFYARANGWRRNGHYQRTSVPFDIIKNIIYQQVAASGIRNSSRMRADARPKPRCRLVWSNGLTMKA